MRPRRRFGQHFLEPAWVRKLVEIVDPASDDAIVEIGPGRGALTEPLAARAGRVLAIEVDRDLAGALAARGIGNLRVMTADVLALDLARVIAEWRGPTPAGSALGADPTGSAGALRVVGNLPYNISSPILFRLLDLAAGPVGVADALLMLQREVAARVAAAPGSRDYGILSVFTALVADATEVLRLPPGAFRPMPAVQSSVVRLRFRPPVVDVGDPDVFAGMVRAAFGQRRKTLANALATFGARAGIPAAEALASADIEPRRRAESLTLAELARLSAAFGSAGGRIVL